MKHFRVTEYDGPPNEKEIRVAEVAVDEYASFECPRCRQNHFHVFIDMETCICVQCQQCSRIFHIKPQD